MAKFLWTSLFLRRKEMSLLKEFEINNEDVSEGLMWGGITMPYVMQQKDGSCFCVIEYEPYEKNNLTKNLNLNKIYNKDLKATIKYYYNYGIDIVVLLRELQNCYRTLPIVILIHLLHFST